MDLHLSLHLPQPVHLSPGHVRLVDYQRLPGICFVGQVGTVSGSPGVHELVEVESTAVDSREGEYLRKALAAA